MAVAGLALSWNAYDRSRQLEQQLVARQEQAQTEVAEALLLARQSQDGTREAAAKLALLEARVSEATVQRSQLDELIQSLGRSRDENLLSDIEAALRVAQQQSALTGSPDPLISTLKQSEERLARYNQPRLDRVRRAVLRDLELVRNASTVDVPTLLMRVDEVVRLIDDLPLAQGPRSAEAGAAGGTSGISGTSGAAGTAVAAPAAASAPVTAAATAPTTPALSWPGLQWLSDAWGRVAREARGLVRLSRVDHPESALAAPEQLFFLRENLKLRLLNARLALLSRQFDLAQNDLRESQRVLQRYFDGDSRRVSQAREMLGQMAQQSRQVALPRPDETLAALASVNAGR